MFNFIVANATAATGLVKSAIDGVTFDGLYTEYFAVLPVLLGISVTWIGVRKAISAVLSTLRSL